jgi:hypothetical protein
MYNEEMRRFWRRYTSERSDISMEDRKEILRELAFAEFIHPDYLDGFLEYLNEILSQLIMYYEDQKTIAFKQGELLHANNKMIDQKMFVETDSTEGKNSGDNEGLEESFANIGERNVKDEFEAAYGKVE